MDTDQARPAGRHPHRAGGGWNPRLVGAGRP
jgi:hypothetical protein